MPYVEVWVEPQDDLDNFSDEDLREELVARAKRKGGGSESRFNADYMIPQPVARETLNSTVMSRSQRRNDLAFKLEEIRVDYVEH